MKRIKMTAVRKICYPDLMERYENPLKNACDVREGQQWIIQEGQQPEDFCDSAWQTIAPFAVQLARGEGNFYDGWMKNPYSAMLSCNDGFRPVTFYLEMLEEE